MDIMGKDLVKTGKIIKINPEDVLNVYKYAKHEINWDPDAFIKKLMEISPYLYKKEYAGKVELINDDDERKGIKIFAPVNTVILPVYMRDKDYMVFKSYKGLIEHKTRETVDISEFSLFDVYQVVDEPFGRLSKVGFSAWIEYRESIKRYGIKAFGPSVVDRGIGYPSKTTLSVAVFTEGSFDEEVASEYLNIIRRLQGVPYSELPRIEETGSSAFEQSIREGMLWLERDLTSILNLVNFLYSYEFDENDIIGWLFKSYSDLVRSFGCKFDDALSSFVRVISAFMF
jgi:hypothetical protein